MTVSGLVEFLLSRLAEDEELAEACSGGWEWLSQSAPQESSPGWMRDKHAQFNVYAERHNPARVLADVAAKRAIIERCRSTRANDDGPAANVLASLVLEDLAGPHKAHPDFDPGWLT